MNQYPLVLAGVGAICIAAIALNILRKKRRNCQWGLWGLLIAYAGLVMYFTLFSRSGSSTRLLLPVPFTAVSKAFSTEGGLRIIDPDSLYQIFLNVMLFVPLGLLLPMTLVRRSFFRTLCLGALMSLAIETIQYFFGMGASETDDLIHNSLGTGLGYGLYALQKRCFPMHIKNRPTKSDQI